MFAVIEDGRVNYYNKDQEIAMYHPAPYMLDAEGTRSENAYWEIISQTQSAIRLKLVADTEGLVYPIDLDPTTYITFTDEANYTQEDVKRSITNWVNDSAGVYSAGANTQLLLHADGDATGSHDVTINGNPQITDTAKFSQAGFFDGTGDYLTVPDSDDWNFGSGDFTIDFWVNFSDLSRQTLISQRDNDNNEWWFEFHNTNGFSFSNDVG